MRIVYWPRIALARKLITEALASVPGTELVVAETLPAVLEALPGAAGLVTADPTAEEARQVVRCLEGPARSVRWLHFISAGQEGFLAAGIPSHLAVTHPGGAVSPTVAEHAMALLLALGRRIPEIHMAAQRGKWDRSMAARCISLEGQNLAIVGFGSIGQEIAKRARGFGMTITAVNRSGQRHALADATYALPELHKALAAADVVAVAIALTADTVRLIDRAAFAAMKPSALFINIARGGVVDQDALRSALETGTLAGAGLDVTEPEPLPDGDPLWSAPNVIISGHFAGGGSVKSQQRLADGARENAVRLVTGQPFVNQIGSASAPEPAVASA
jgi:phosphoglycerate dehydrogenase-like enzyme